MNEQETIKTLEENGGKLWEKADKRRVYFDTGIIARALGYDWSKYKSGQVSSASLNGERISNSEMRRVLDGLAYSKFWYDLTDDKFHWRAEVGAEPHLESFAGLLREKLAEVETA